MKMKLWLSTMMGAMFLVGCMPEKSQSTESFSAKIEDLTLTAGTVEKNSSEAGEGAVVGAVVGGVAAVVTGGLAPALGAIGGGAVGSMAGQGTSERQISPESVMTCRFRIVVNGEPFGFYAEKDDRGFQKCVTMKNGDPVRVEILRYFTDKKEVSKYFSWHAGDSSGQLR